jgi:GR25 family glycosyltransferase involved in LPS biosynthesis
MEEQFNKHNIKNYTRIPAIDGSNIKNLNKGYIEGITYVNNCKNSIKSRSNINSNIIACTLSHFKSFHYAKYIMKEQYEYIVILEDDVNFEFMDKWEESFDEIAKNCPNNWNIIQLSTINSHILKKMINNKNKFVKKQLGDINYTYLGTAMYMISKSGIDYLLQKYYNVEQNLITLYGTYPAVDGLLYNIPESYIYTRPLIYTNDELFESNIITPSSGKHNKFGINSSKIVIQYYKNI